MPEARHRDAWAEEQTAPSRAAHFAEQQPIPSEAPRQARIVGATSADTGGDDDVLVVVSKLKKYVRDHSGMNTSDGAMATLSDHLRALCREAIRHAQQDGRKTVMERDFLPFCSPRR